MTDFYLAHFGLNIHHTFLYWLPWKALSLYNIIIILAALLRHNSKNNMTKNRDKIVILWYDIFAISPTPSLDDFSTNTEQSGCFSILLCASSRLSSTLQDARKRHEDGGIESSDISSLSLASLQSVISCAKWPALKTFKININKARCPVEIWHAWFKLQR